MKSKPKASNGYVEHPRYGQGPNHTGLNVNDFDSEYVCLHSSTRRGDNLMIPDTAIHADYKRQNFTVLPISHYIDVEIRCRDCERLFLFYAKEQQYWFEELGFPIDADCVRCCECRKNAQHLKLLRERYNELITQSKLKVSEQIELAHTAVTLVDEGIFKAEPLNHARRALNLHPQFPERSELQRRLKSAAEKAESRDLEFLERKKLAEQHRFE